VESSVTLVSQIECKEGIKFMLFINHLWHQLKLSKWSRTWIMGCWIYGHIVQILLPTIRTFGIIGNLRTTTANIQWNLRPKTNL